jgi:PAS domain S-box-containing protein
MEHISAGTYVGLVRDVTARQRTELALQQSEARFRALFEQAAVGMCEVDLATTRYVRVNQRFCDILGYAADELVGRGVGEFRHPEDAAGESKLAEVWRRDVTTAPPVDKRHMRKDGRAVWVRLTVSCLSPGHGQPESLMAIVEDVTESRRSEELLRESERRLATVFDVALTGIIVTRIRDEVITDANEAFARQIGWHRNEIIGRTTAELGIYAMPEHREEVYRQLKSTGGVHPLELQVRRKSGATGNFLLTAGPAEIDGEQVAIGVWHDITELRRTDAALSARARRGSGPSSSRPASAWRWSSRGQEPSFKSISATAKSRVGRGRTCSGGRGGASHSPTTSPPGTPTASGSSPASFARTPAKNATSARMAPPCG